MAAFGMAAHFMVRDRRRRTLGTGSRRSQPTKRATLKPTNFSWRLAGGSSGCGNTKTRKRWRSILKRFTAVEVRLEGDIPSVAQRQPRDFELEERVRPESLMAASLCAKGAPAFTTLEERYASAKAEERPVDVGHRVIRGEQPSAHEPDSVGAIVCHYSSKRRRSRSIAQDTTSGPFSVSTVECVSRKVAPPATDSCQSHFHTIRQQHCRWTRYRRGRRRA
jgi:hypothetical protein